MVDIGGSVAPGYEAVRDAFVQNFEEHGDVGAGYSLYVDGAKVVDLWGGIADRKAGAPYTEDTLQLVFSTTKGATAACVNLLAQRGEHYRFERMQPFFDPGPISAPSIPIQLAAVGPLMTRLAGEVADAWVAHPTNASPRFLREVTLPNLEKGALRAARRVRRRGGWS